MKKLGFLFALLILFYGCSSDDSNSDQGTGENPYHQNPEVAENVIIILEENATLTSSEADLINGIYKIDFFNEVPEIKSNDVIVGDEGQGFLRRVASVSSNGNTVSMQTTQATIDDVYNNASIELTTDISERGRATNLIKHRIQINYLHDGVRMNENGLGYDFSNTIIFEDNVGVFKIANGNATFDPNFSFKADYSFLSGLDFLEFKADNANLVINCDFDVTVSGSLSLPQFSQTLVDYDKYLTFLVAGVPVVVVVNTQLVAELNANIDTNVTWLSSWTNTFGVTTGIKYENNDWTGNFNLNSDLAINSMDFGGQVNIAQNLTITPRASLKFYGVIGPYCQPELTEDFAFNVASPSLDWDANLKAGLDLTTGVDITVFGNTLADFSTTDSYEQSIWNAPEKIEIVSGNNQIGIQGLVLDEPLKVKVTDLLDNSMPFVPVYFTVNEGNGSVDNVKVMTDQDGFAEVFWTLGNNSDPQVVEASVKKADGTNIESSPVIFNSNQSLPETIEIVSGNNQIGEQGVQLPEPLKVLVKDDEGNFMSNIPVYFTVTAGNGTVNNISVVTDDNGFSEVLWTLGNTPDPQSVEAIIKDSNGNLIDSVTFNANSGGNLDLLAILTSRSWNFNPDSWAVFQTCYDSAGNELFSDSGFNGGPGVIIFKSDYSIDVPSCFCILSNNTFSIGSDSVNLNITAEYGSYGNTFSWSFSGAYDETIGGFVGSGTTNATTYHSNGEVECEYSGSATTMNLE